MKRVERILTGINPGNQSNLPVQPIAEPAINQ
jgi:hypothetical protein